MTRLPAGPSPIPIELVASGRDLTEPRLSPDGRLVAFVQRWGARSAVTVVDVDGGPERMLTTSPDPRPGRGLGGGCFDWLPDGSGVVYVANDGDVRVQRWSGPPIAITNFGRDCAAPCVSPTSGFVAVVVDEAEVWAVAIDPSSPTRPIRLDDGTDGFCFDPSVGPTGTRVAWQAWSAPDMPWDAACRVDVELLDGRAPALRRSRVEAAAVQQPRFAPSGEPLCVHDGSGWSNVHVGEANVAAEPFEHADPTWGMGQRSYAMSPDGTAVAFTRNEGGFGRLCLADRSTGTLTELARGVHGGLSWVGRSLVALRTGARTPTRIVRYDMSSRTATRTPDDMSNHVVRTTLAVAAGAAWDHVDLPEPEPVATRAADTTLFSRRYAAGAGRLLVWVHGGPTDQWKVEFRPRISYWSSRGWDVLVVDPRGSTGHGRAYQRALNGRWGRLDVDDTAAMIRDAHDRGWASPATTVVMGGSSGGLTVLGVLADHGELVAGGVTSYPVSDLAALASSTHRFEAHYTETLVGPAGDANTRARFRELSPIHRADRITKPVLIFHGTDDVVVPIAQSEALAGRITAAGGHVDLVVYQGEGHGWRDPANQRDEYERTEAFLAAHVSSQR